LAWQDIATYVVLALVGVRLADGLRHSLRGRGRTTVADVWRGVRWRHVWPVPFVVTVVATLATLLTQLPGLDWGWWSVIGGEGNPIAGSADATVGSVWEWLIPLVFVALLLPTLPLFALGEERIFRSGAESWSPARRTFKTLQFGLVHALIGIPIGAAIALSVGGAYFLGVYLRQHRATGSASGSLMESTRAHTAYNAMIMVLVVGLALSTAFG
jgi:hypothetical protein